MLEEALRGHPVHPPSLRDEQLFPQFLTDTLPLIITVNYEPGDYVVPTVLAVGTVLEVQMHGIIGKDPTFCSLPVLAYRIKEIQRRREGNNNLH